MKIINPDFISLLINVLNSKKLEENTHYKFEQTGIYLIPIKFQKSDSDISVTIYVYNGIKDHLEKKSTTGKSLLQKINEKINETINQISGQI